MTLSSNTHAVEIDDPGAESGQALFKYAARTEGPYYVVDAPMSRIWRGTKKKEG